MNNNIKKIAYNLLSPILSVKAIRNIFKKFSTVAFFFEQEKICKILSTDKTVLSGPFKGLRYKSFEAAGSVLISKIIGCYEDELAPTIEKICKKKYTDIIDVGCAEGYYSNGFAMRIPSAKVFAYDLDEHARRLCIENAIANNLQNRVEVRNYLDADTLAQLPFSGKGLIISDCEGFEKELFTEASVRNLSNCDLIIELHDCTDDTISQTILPLFKNTHQLSLIKSNPHKKLADYNFIKKIKGLNDSLIDERNGIIMYWAFLEAN